MDVAGQLHGAYLLLIKQGPFTGVLLTALHCGFIGMELYLMVPTRSKPAAFSARLGVAVGAKRCDSVASRTRSTMCSSVAR